MTLCEFCVLQQADGRCSRGHDAKKMRCVDFTPGIERFCSTPADYTGREQLKQMASFFGIKEGTQASARDERNPDNAGLSQEGELCCGGTYDD